MWNPENEPDVFCNCENCGSEIYFGEEYYKITFDDKDYPYCKECIDDAREEAYIEPYEPDGCDLAKEAYYESLEEDEDE